MFRIERLVGSIAACTVCELRDPSGHEVVHVKRNRPNRNRFVTVRNQCQSRPRDADKSLTCECPACKSSARCLGAVSQVGWITMGLWRSHQREMRTVSGSSGQSSKSSVHTNRADGKAFAEVVPDGVHGGLDRGFKAFRNLRTMHVDV